MEGKEGGKEGRERGREGEGKEGSVTEQREGGWFLHDKVLQKGFRLSVSGGSFPPHPPARFEMPASRGKTSLNARDW